MAVEDLLRACNLETDETVYTMIKLPPAAIWAAAGILADWGEPFSALIADKDEVSLILPLEAWEDYEARLPLAVQQGAFRLITFGITLDFDVVGFMALVATILASVEVSLIPLGAFSRDHILVPEAGFQKAWDALKSAQKG